MSEKVNDPPYPAPLNLEDRVLALEVTMELMGRRIDDLTAALAELAKSLGKG